MIRAKKLRVVHGRWGEWGHPRRGKAWEDMTHDERRATLAYEKARRTCFLYDTSYPLCRPNSRVLDFEGIQAAYEDCRRDYGLLHNRGKKKAHLVREVCFSIKTLRNAARDSMQDSR